MRTSPRPTALSLLPAALLIVAGAAPAASHTDDPPPPPAMYEALRAARPQFAGQLRAATLKVDRVEFEFEQGGLYLLPQIGGTSTGAAFLGKGRVRIEPPDDIEREQLDRHLDTETLDEEFERVVFRFGEGFAERLLAQVTTGGRDRTNDARKVWEERHDKARDERLYDLDARVLADLVERAAGTPDPRGDLFWADVDGDDWFAIELDPDRQEEVFVTRSRGRDRVRDIWTAFHLLDEYGIGASMARVAAIPDERWEPRGETPEITTDLWIDDNGRIEASARVVIVPARPVSTLRLLISPLLEVTEARLLDLGPETPATTDPVADLEPNLDLNLEFGDARTPAPLQGAALEFVQARFGRGMNEDRWDPRLTIVLPRTLAAAERVEIGLRYRGDLIERLQNRDYFVRDSESWYPRWPGARRARMTMTFRTADRHRVATAGERVAERGRDGTRLESYRVDTATTNMSFQYGDLDPKLYDDDLLPITVYESPNTTGFSPGNREQTLADLRGAFAMYTDYFGPAPVDRLTVTEMPGLGGQSFPGFVMLSFATFGAMNTGEAELFRTHEVAHQWFGNEVSWDNYRDQWMSEGFAQYAAALYALNVQEDEDKFLDMLQAWRKDVLNQIDVRQRLGNAHFGFTPEVLQRSEGFESGPLWIGYRLASFDEPNDYRILAYEKGAFILHMLRALLYDWEAGDDTRFRDLMTSFYTRHRGGHPSTEEFRHAVEEIFGEPMDWFFDQWVYGSRVPTYRPDLDEERTADGWRLRGTVRQQEVPDGFHMPVPIRVTYEDGRTEVLILPVTGPRTEVDLPLSGRPDEVEFNVLESVLANVR